MAQISIIQKADITEAGRFDAEYFKPEYLKIEENIKRNSFSFLGGISSLFVKGIFNINSSVYSKEGIPFVRISNLRNLQIERTDIVYIPEYENQKNIKTELKYGDIILSKTAYPACSLVTVDRCNTSQDTIAIKLKKDSKINNKFLVIFLNTKFGMAQMMRYFTGNIQMHLNLTESKQILIPNLNTNFQNKISEFFNKSIQKQSQAKDLYAEAENLLLVELDLLDYQPKHHLTFSATKADIEQTQRFDAEYFQPKYGDIIQKIENYAGGFDILDYFIKNYSTGFPFKSDSYTDKGCYLIRINNIEKGQLNLENANKIPENDTNLSIKDIAKKGDILISMSGTIGNSCKIPKGINAVINQRIFRFTSINFNKETLTLLINSLVGLSQLQRIGTGGVQTNISGNDIRKLKIPLINQKTQNQIAEKITLSHTLRKQSKALLELAKTKVEQEIER